MSGTVLAGAVHTTPSEVITSDHARLKALKERLEVRYAGRDDTQILHQLSTEHHGPDVERRIV